MRALEILLTTDIFSLRPFSQAQASSIIQSVSAFFHGGDLNVWPVFKSLFWMTFALMLNALLDVSERLRKKKNMLKEGEVCNGNEQMDLWEEQHVMMTFLFKVYSFVPLLLQKGVIRAINRLKIFSIYVPQHFWYYIKNNYSFYFFKYHFKSLMLI